MRILALVPDAFGAPGGIAKYNRDLLEALASYCDVTDVVALPRNHTVDRGPGASKIRFLPAPRPGVLAYASWVFRKGLSHRCDLLVVGHLNFLPLAWLVSVVLRLPMVVVIYGIEAWTPKRRYLTRFFLQRAFSIVSISRFTAERLGAWTRHQFTSRIRIIPCALDKSEFGPGSKPQYLLDRHGLRDRKIILTVARLSSAERYKGVDEIMDVLPRLRTVDPAYCYLIVGHGDDAQRLRDRAATPELSGSVTFAGYVLESEKADYYRLADVFAMPGRGEGFGYVYLEALACGIPVIASCADASSETVLGGQLGAIVNPDSPLEIQTAIESLAQRGRSATAPNLEAFSPERFTLNWARLLEDVQSKRKAP